MMPGLFVSAQDLASIAAVKPAFTHQRVSLILSNACPPAARTCRCILFAAGEVSRQRLPDLITKPEMGRTGAITIYHRKQSTQRHSEH
jgi:hypothetical protein